MFRQHYDDHIVDDVNEHKFYRNVVVFCPKKRVARMALWLSLETAKTFVHQRLCGHDDLMQAIQQRMGWIRGSADCWVEMTKEALFHKQKDDVISLLKLLDKWHASSTDDAEKQHDADQLYNDNDEAFPTCILQDEPIVKTIVQIASVYGSDEGVASSIAQLARNSDRRDLKNCVKLVDTLILMQSSATLSVSPGNIISDRLASA